MPEDTPQADPSAEQPQARQIRVGVDERSLQTSYANAFRTHGTPEEVLLDFGLNLVNPAAADKSQPQVVLHVNNRIILNYYTAKRLAVTLSQLIRKHEQQFGELELDIAKRRQDNL